MTDTVSPFPFATASELRQRWPEMPATADAQAAVHLEDASQFILDVAPRARHASENTRRRIVCAVVRRSMQAPPPMLGTEQTQLSAGPFQQTVRPINPHGDYYLTGLEKRALGVGRQRAGEVNLLRASRRFQED